MERLKTANKGLRKVPKRFFNSITVRKPLNL